MLEFPKVIPTVDDANVILYFATDDLKRTGEAILETFKRDGRIDVMEVTNGIEQGPAKERLMQLIMNDHPYDETVVDRVVADTIKKIKQRLYREKRQALQIELQKAERDGDSSLSDQLVLEQKKLIQEEKGL